MIIMMKYMLFTSSFGFVFGAYLLGAFQTRTPTNTVRSHLRPQIEAAATLPGHWRFSLGLSGMSARCNVMVAVWSMDRGCIACRGGREGHGGSDGDDGEVLGTRLSCQQTWTHVIPFEIQGQGVEAS